MKKNAFLFHMFQQKRERAPIRETKTKICASIMEGVCSSTTVESKLTQFPPHNVITKFPVKLWRIVNSCTSGAISWSRDGKSVKIYRKLFEEEFLRTNTGPFKTESFNSFIRQLNLYGFQKVLHKNNLQHDDPLNSNFEFCEYHNQNFKRGFPELIPYVQRRAKSRNESYADFADRFSRVINPTVVDGNIQTNFNVTRHVPVQQLSDGTLIIHGFNARHMGFSFIENSEDLSERHSSFNRYSTRKKLSCPMYLSDLQQSSQNSSLPNTDETEERLIEIGKHLEKPPAVTSKYLQMSPAVASYVYILTTDTDDEDNSSPYEMKTGNTHQNIMCSESTPDDNYSKSMIIQETGSHETPDANFLLVHRDNGNIMSAYPLEIDQHGIINVKIPVTLPNTKTVKNIDLALVASNITK